MTQQSGNPDKDAQCNNHDVLKADYMFSAIASCLAGDSGLWKDFNETARQAFRAQAFPDHFIKGYFEQLQHTITRARSNRGGQQQVRQASPAAMRGQVQGQMVRGHPGQQFIQRFPGQGGQTIISPHGMMVQDGGRPPGIPRHTEPFQRRTPQGNVSRFNSFHIKINLILKFSLLNFDLRAPRGSDPFHQPFQAHPSMGPQGHHHGGEQQWPWHTFR